MLARRSILQVYNTFRPNFPKFHGFRRLLDSKSKRKFNEETNAVCNLLQRSKLNLYPSFCSENLNVTYFSKPEKSQSNENQSKSTPPKKSNPHEKRPSSSANGPNNNGKNNNDDDEQLSSVFAKAVVWMMGVYLFLTLISLLFPDNSKSEATARYVSWNEFVHHMLAAGEVKELVIRPEMDVVTIILQDNAVIKGRRIDSNIFHIAIADASKFEEKLRDAETRLGVKEGVSITYERNSDLTGKIILTLLFATLIISFMSRLRGGKNPMSMDAFSSMSKARFTLVQPFEGGKGVYFKDVAGLQEAKQEVMEFVDYLKTPAKYQRLGAKVPKGALLLGPPGCGKTLLAKAVATEAEVPFLSMNGSEFIEMIGGLGAARVRSLFQEAKKRAPCIIYIDEIDAIGRQRKGVGGMEQSSSGESEQTLNQLLVELDGMATKQGVLMLASTNRADILDKALLRPGRFDRHIVIDLPNLHERKEIFEKHLSPIAIDKSPSVYSERLARLTPGFSGADIANVCNEAALHAARHRQKKVTVKNLEYAVERLVGGTEKRSHALSPEERRVIAYHESGHALVGWLLPSSDVLLKVTIVPRTTLALGFAQYTPRELKLISKEELFDKMCMALGGRAAESLTFNKITTGAQNDLEKVTKMAYEQIKHYGMSDVIGPMYVSDEADHYEKPFSNNLDRLIDVEARTLIAKAYDTAQDIIKKNADKLKLLAEALLQRETLNYQDVVELIGPPIHEDKKKKIDPIDFEQSIKTS